MATNLQFLKSQNVQNGSITFEMTNCFNANYDVYKIIFSGMQLSITNEHYPAFRFLDNTDTEISSANYDSAALIKLSSAYQEYRITNDNEFHRLFIMAATTTGQANCEMTIFNPFNSGSYTFMKSNDSSTFSLDGRNGIGVLKLAQSVTGFKLTNLSGYLMGMGKVSVYGVK